MLIYRTLFYLVKHYKDSFAFSRLLLYSNNCFFDVQSLVLMPAVPMSCTESLSFSNKIKCISDFLFYQIQSIQSNVDSLVPFGVESCVKFEIRILLLSYTWIQNDQHYLARMLSFISSVQIFFFLQKMQDCQSLCWCVGSQFCFVNQCAYFYTTILLFYHYSYVV